MSTTYFQKPLDNSAAQHKLGFPNAKATLGRMTTGDLYNEYLQR